MCTGYLCICMLSGKLWTQCPLPAQKSQGNLWMHPRVFWQSINCMQQGYVLSFDLNILQIFWHIFSTKFWFVEPVTLPPIVSGCLSNNDCPDYTACQSRKCINPCTAPNVCASNANCRVTRHQAVCTCPDGYIGSPEISCSLRKLHKSC